MLNIYTTGDDIPPEMVVFKGHFINHDNFNALNIIQQEPVVPSVESAPS